MKKTYLFGAALAASVALSSNAQTTIAKWTFETSAPAGTGITSMTGIAPEVGSGSASTVHAVSTTISSPAGNGSAHSLSATAWTAGDYVQFQTSTTGFQDIKLSYDQTSSNTGPKFFDLTYSTDGLNFTTFASLNTVLPNGGSPNPSWNATTASSAYSFSFDLSAITALNDASTVYFRLVENGTTSANGGTVAAGGTDRLDNFSVVGTLVPVPEPSTVALLGVGAVAGFFVLARRRS